MHTTLEKLFTRAHQLFVDHSSSHHSPRYHRAPGPVRASAQPRVGLLKYRSMCSTHILFIVWYFEGQIQVLNPPSKKTVARQQLFTIPRLSSRSSSSSPLFSSLSLFPASSASSGSSDEKLFQCPKQQRACGQLWYLGSIPYCTYSISAGLAGSLCAHVTGRRILGF